MHKQLFLLVLVFVSISYSQNNVNFNIYLDENNNQIDELTYSTRVLKNIYRENIINKDTVIVKKLRKLYEFDSLNSIELKQVQNILHKYLDVMDFNKNIILVYRDSLLGFNDFRASFNQIKEYDALDVDSEKEFLKRRNRYDSEQKKCKKFIRKNNVSVVYTYSEKINFNYEPDNYKNQKLPSVLKSIFFDGKKRGTVILKPNGEFFFYSYLTQKQVQRMLNNDWQSYIKDYNLVMSDESVFSMEFIENMRTEHREDMRQLAMKKLGQNNNSKIAGNRISSTNRIRIKSPLNCLGYANY